MQQFNTYRDSSSDQFWQDLLRFRSLFSMELEPPFAVLRSGLRYLCTTYPTERRVLLIAARLMRWGVWGQEEMLSHIGSNLDPASLQKLGWWDRQELINCLGASLSSQYLGLSQQDIHTYAGENQTFLHAPSFQESWVYTPQPSGFFSIVENIVTAAYFACMQGKNLIIDDVSPWWTYPISFNSIFGGQFRYLSEHKGGTLSGFDFAWLRQHFIGSIATSVGSLQHFTSFKLGFYSSLHAELLSYLQSTGCSVDRPQNYAALFLRGGDKLATESVDIPLGIVLEDCRAVMRDTDTLIVMSDDYQLAERVGQRLLKGSFQNLSRKNRSGYYFGQPLDKSDLHELLTFYLLLSDAKYSLGCASANLINAANWSNSHSFAYKVFLSSCPVHRYFLI
jgi:hypothetical protein